MSGPEPHGLVGIDKVLGGGWVATCTCGHTTTAYATRARAAFWQAEHHGRHVEPLWTRDDLEDFWRSMRAAERKELGGMSDLDAAIERIQTVRMLVDQQAKGAALTGHREQFAHGWHVLEGIDLAMAAIWSPHMKTVEELNHG